jgi:hypothetical protein
MKPIALLTFILTLSAAIASPYYDGVTGRIYNSKASIPSGRGQVSGLRNMRDADLVAHEIYALVNDATPDGMVRVGWNPEPVIIDGVAHRVPICMTQVEYDAEQAARQAAELHEAYRQIGVSVTAIRTLLVSLGYDLPCDSTTVISELTHKALTGQLSVTQRDAKNDLADLYLMLRGAGVTDAQIASVWAYIKEGGR